jgi:arginine decarboxylase
MKIHVTAGTGTGTTKLSAFDAALNDAGVANYNLLRLSSVIPPESTVVTHDTEPIPDHLLPGVWGDRLYIVMAEQRVETPNEEAWAGIGWVQEGTTRKGLFVEHEGSSEQAVRNDIEQSLRGLMKTRGIDFGEIHMHVTGITCIVEPACALVIAVYQASDWNNKALQTAHE